jgi:RNA polymerase sigma factor (sigma-70 family)
MKDYRLTVKVRNNRILKAIEESGGAIGCKWCAANGLSYPLVNDLVNLTTSPLDVSGELRNVAAHLCDVLGKLPEDLWSNEQLYPLEKNFSELELDHSQVVGLMHHGAQSYLLDTSELEQSQAQAIVAAAVSSLTSREQELIAMLYTDDMNPTQCAKALGVSVTYVRDLHSRAITKLRHPKQSVPLLALLDGSR